MGADPKPQLVTSGRPLPHLRLGVLDDTHGRSDRLNRSDLHQPSPPPLFSVPARLAGEEGEC